MAPHPILRTRIAALLEELDLAEKMLDSDSLSPQLRTQVDGTFGILIQQRRGDLRALEGKVAGHRDGVVKGLWDRFHEIDEDCGRLSREYLAFLGGVQVRGAGLDGGVCEVADALLDELARSVGIDWPRFTILAEDEFLAGMTDIIRLRFPPLSIWNLPVAAHELGHFVTSELRDGVAGGRPLLDLVADLKRKEGAALAGQVPERTVQMEVEKLGFHLHEHLADLFAVYTLGPSYACTCIRLRFDPRRAYVEHPRHPCDADRVWFVLRALEKINEGHYQAVVDHLRDIWRHSVSAAGWSDSDRTSRERPWLSDTLEEMRHALGRNLHRNARYRGWDRAITLRHPLLASGRPTAVADCTLADLLNAAWLARLEREEETVRVGEKALDLALRII